MSMVEQKRIRPGYEPISGYVLEKRLGRGGYGEVWLAEAPGGLKKAVKFVYGQQDERRAAQEMKSLERIKDVQHPFILSLERFGLVENQLVIVTELADGSLEDVYNQHRQRGSCGIPRDRLLKYMRDAADALDHLHTLYKLQHLDIKPGNLLMVGGRVKVADFGLLKDLGDVECSIVGGLTPIYAPPEVFDGRPSLHSDQYSLAVMYQELLTSTRPFGGRTIAQLATQHVHNAPNLDPLPAADRPIVARALEKSPERRFDSCSEFVERLIQPRVQTVVTEAEVEPGPKRAATIEDLPQLAGGMAVECDSKPAHVLVVALGGTGWSGLKQLRSRVEESGAASPVSLHSVLIDTDRDITRLARSFKATHAVARCHVVETPLRTAGEYRALGNQRLKTISRRWIYNVPRHGQTDGMRPLGRLALVDHGADVMESLRAAVRELKQALGESETAKVYVLGSLTGGTGGGMYIDVAHLLRHVLDDSEMENVGIVSLLTSTRFQGDPSRPLALHATKAAIAELKYFLKPGNGYPGDAGAGWPSVPAARTPLRDAYLIAEPTVPGAPSALYTAIDYLWCDACVCGQWLEKARRESHGDEQVPTGLRSVGAVEIGGGSDWQAELLAPYLTRSLLLQWLGNPRESAPSASRWTDRVQRRCRLEADSLKAEALHWFGESRQQRRRRLFDHLRTLDSQFVNDNTALRARLLRWLAAAIDPERGEGVARQVIEQTDREVRVRLQDRRLDFSGAVAGVARLAGVARAVHERLMRESEREFQTLDRDLVACSENRTTVGTATTAQPRDGVSEALQRACDLGERLLDVVAARVGAAIAMKLEQDLAALAETYTDASTRLAQAIRQLSDGGDDPGAAVSESLRAEAAKVLEPLHQRRIAGDLMRAIQQPGSIGVSELVNDLNTATAVMVREWLDDRAEANAVDPAERDGSHSLDSRGAITVEHGVCCDTGCSTLVIAPDQVESTESSSATQTQRWQNDQRQPASMSVESALDVVRPALLECGGKQRLILVCRDRREKDELLLRLPEPHRDQVTSVLTRSPVAMLIHEAGGIDPEALLAWLDSLTGDDGQISARLATRCDLDWS